MKTDRLLRLVSLCCGVSTWALAQAPQMINYQGRLLLGTNLVNGNVGLSLRLYDQPAGGALLYEDSNTVTVVDGLYATFIGDNTTAGSLTNALANAAVYVEAAVNGAPLTPRERIASVAYALNAGDLAGAFWKTGGNAGTSSNQFVGTTDAQPLEFRTGGSRALRIEGDVHPVFFYSPKITGGSPYNFIGPNSAGSVIAGGGSIDQPNRMEGGGSFCFIGAGLGNFIATNSASGHIGAGFQNRILGANDGSIGGGYQNTITTNAHSATVAGGALHEIGAGASYATIGGGGANRAAGLSATVAGGYANNAGATDAAVLGGYLNTTYGYRSTVGAGAENSVQSNADYAVLGGGFRNSIQDDADQATIGGGSENSIQPVAAFATIDGGSRNSIQSYANWATLGGGYSNRIQTYAEGATIGGGRGNAIRDSSYYGTVCGGRDNTIQTNSTYATVGGGRGNTIWPGADHATIGGGLTNTILGVAQSSTIGGGGGNTIGDVASGAVVGGGYNNSAEGYASVVPGGYGNYAGGFYSFAAGHGARALHAGAFVWCDDSVADGIESTNRYSVTFRAHGGYRFFSTGLATLGAELSPNATAWSALSDRNAKENFAPLDTREILDRLAALPLTAWNYKADPDRRRYIGPTAQDFHAAFGLGGDTTINTLDSDGVALAAIQALDSAARDQRAEVSQLRKENAELRARLDRLEALLQAN